MAKEVKADYLDRLGGRKFVFSFVMAIGFFALAVAGRISYEQLMDGVLLALGIFSVANVGAKFVGRQ